jgi:ribosomal protein S18 acetylase RimI-like enzyme
MTSLTFTPITNLDDDLLIPWLNLYETAFPPEERVLVSAFLKILKAKERGQLLSTEMLAAVDEDQHMTGMVFYEFHPEERTAALWYMAIDTQLRSQGLGSRVYHEIVSRAQVAGCQAMLFEVEIPDNAHSPEAQILAKRRIQFYRRNGAKLLTGIHYLQSVGSHQPVTPMHLMIHPLIELDPQKAFILAQSLFDEAITKVGSLGFE